MRIILPTFLFILFINYGEIYSQSDSLAQNDSLAKKRSSSKFELQPGIIATRGHITSYVGFSYNFNDNYSFSIGLLPGVPFSNGMGLSSGANIKIMSLGKTFLSADVLYKLNGPAISRNESVDSILTEYKIPPSQFISLGLSLDIMFTDKSRLRITTSYNIALDEYSPTLTKGVENPHDAKLINWRLSNSLGLHLIYIVPISKRL